jgi:hypothetical protein
MRVVPSTPGSSFVYENEEEADALFAALKDGTVLPEYGKAVSPDVDTAAKPAAPALPAAPPVKPGDVSLSVLNGTGRTGLARAEADRLTPKGFEVVEVADADSANYAQTVVFYHKGKEPQAQLVADLYGAQTKPVPSTIKAQGDVVLVVGPKSGTATMAASSPAAATSPTPTPSAARSAPKTLIHAC